MTPLEINTYARQQHNSVGDDFYSDAEIYNHIWHAQNILAKEAMAIENTYSTSTVVGQQEYTFPTTAIAIKRITWNGQALARITFKEDDWLTGFDAATTSTGEPSCYALFDRVIYLRPVPSAVYTLKIFSYDQPSAVSAGSTLDIPTDFHLDICNYLLWRMTLKDQNFEGASYHKAEWDAAIVRAKSWTRKRLIAGGFNVVRDEDALSTLWENY